MLSDNGKAFGSITMTLLSLISIVSKAGVQGLFEVLYLNSIDVDPKIAFRYIWSNCESLYNENTQLNWKYLRRIDIY